MNEESRTIRISKSVYDRIILDKIYPRETINDVMERQFPKVQPKKKKR